MISFVGAGPGASDLLTLRGAQRLAAAEVVVWAASLVSESLLEHCRPDVVLHDSKSMTLEQVCAVYAAHPDAPIVRLHSGDPTIYSAIGEQIEWCRANDREFEIVPGVSSMSAAAAVAGCELTIPGVSQSVVLTRLASGTRASMPDRETIEAHAAIGATMVVFLSVAHVELLAQRLLAAGSAYLAETPVVVVKRATWPDQQLVRTTVADMAEAVRSAAFDATTIFLIGPALAGATDQRSHVYAADYTTRFRTADDELPPITVVGVVGGNVFGEDARRAIATADVLVGSPRHLARFTPGRPHERVELTGPLPPIIQTIDAHRSQGRHLCVLSSGDPGFFGITRLLSERFGADALDVLPAPSSVSLAFAASGMSWDDADVVSAHGRPFEQAVSEAIRSPKVAVLTAPSNPPEVLGKELVAHGCGPRRVTVASRLGEHDQHVIRTDVDGLAAGQFDPMSVVLLVTPDVLAPDAPTISWGRNEHSFAHRDGMITKAEVRSIVLGTLQLPRTGVLWDVGAGSGSVGIEAATVAPGLRVYAIERSDDDARNIVTNAAATGVARNVEVIVGNAPHALVDLPPPDRVFVGGGGLDVVRACWDRLPPGGLLVASFVVLDRAVSALELLGEMIQVHIDRAAPIGRSGMRLEPSNPVFVCWGRR